MSKVKAFVVIDHTKAKSIHMALNKDGAIQAHLIHYGLVGLDLEPKVRCTNRLPMMRRERMCWDSLCLLGSMSCDGEDL